MILIQLQTCDLSQAGHWEIKDISPHVTDCVTPLFCNTSLQQLYFRINESFENCKFFYTQ